MFVNNSFSHLRDSRDVWHWDHTWPCDLIPWYNQKHMLTLWTSHLKNDICLSLSLCSLNIWRNRKQTKKYFSGAKTDKIRGEKFKYIEPAAPKQRLFLQNTSSLEPNTLLRKSWPQNSTKKPFVLLSIEEAHSLTSMQNAPMETLGFLNCCQRTQLTKMHLVKEYDESCKRLVKLKLIYTSFSKNVYVFISSIHKFYFKMTKFVACFWVVWKFGIKRVQNSLVHRGTTASPIWVLCCCSLKWKFQLFDQILNEKDFFIRNLINLFIKYWIF